MTAKGTRPSDAFEKLIALGASGPRFHGTPGIDEANAFLRERLVGLGLPVVSSTVRTPGWSPGQASRLRVIAPTVRDVACWPMLRSGATDPVTATIRPYGFQGLWADAMVWTKFEAVDELGRVVAYIHGRDGGPAAPQPLPIGSNETVPHLSIGRIDAEQFCEWIADGFGIQVTLEAHSSHLPEASSENLTVTFPGQDDRGRVVVGGHYDTFWNTPGAYDNGSGTVALLLLAEHWTDQPPSRSIQLTFFTAEEWHLAGSRSLIAKSSPEDLDAVDFMINLDGLGRGDLLEVFIGPETFEEQMVEEIRAFGRSTRDELEVVSRFPPSYGTDHAAFYAAGVPSVHLTFNDLHRLHQPDDLPNEGIARNIAWTVDLVRLLVERVERPERVPRHGIVMPF